jgi:hypothetical protein
MAILAIAKKKKPGSDNHCEFCSTPEANCLFILLLSNAYIWRLSMMIYAK